MTRKHNVPLSKSKTANLTDRFCQDCGWPVICACCNDEFLNYKNASEYDWWMYCSNKGCKNHDGEGVFQYDPEWAISFNE
jgi:hypothetical protein